MQEKMKQLGFLRDDSQSAYFIACKNNGNEILYKKVEGVKIDIGFDLFTYIGADDDMKGWAVSDGVTGTRLTHFWPTELEALSEVEQKIKEKGEESLENTILTFVLSRGVTPRYYCEKAVCNGKN